MSAEPLGLVSPATRIATLKKKLEEMKSFTKSDPKNTPYSSTITVLSKLGEIKSLTKFKIALKYAWSKVQTEAVRFWRNSDLNNSTKTVFNEDARLMVIAYVLTQLPNKAVEEFVPSLYATFDFMNEQLFEECAPLATFEAAIKVVQFEYEENIVQ